MRYTDMPVLDGQTTIPFGRALAPAVSIVLMGGGVELNSDADTIAELVKPFQLEELQCLASARLVDRRPEQPLRRKHGANGFRDPIKEPLDAYVDALHLAKTTSRKGRV